MTRAIVQAAKSLEVDSMGILQKLIPFRKAVDSAVDMVDQMVVDKDKAIELKSQIRLAEIEIRTVELELESDLQKLKEESYQKELQTVTTPRVDAFHKLARVLLSILSMVQSPITIIILANMGVELSLEVLAAVASGNLPAGIYTWKKGKGYQVGKNPNQQLTGED
jgi:hypothetical protein